MPRVRRLSRLSRREVLLLGKALKAVLKVRAHLVRRTHKTLRKVIEGYPVVTRMDDVSIGSLREVAWSVASVSRLVPGATCLTQASAGQILLAQRGLPSVVRLSVPRRRVKEGKLSPHAWLMVGDTIILGGTPEEYAQHTMLHDYTVGGSSG